ncbi:glycoside hydrolase family 2 TIM barrel-domain containing protein [Pseudonocardia phyllosphaerae]|uniref:glycoside hydrolase family 2 TIM barrel-domain containing protein n=1 Tax=Pseudonocardia phyllosphaerae TaxID=3390502 RepID=UPI003979F7DA
MTPAQRRRTGALAAVVLVTTAALLVGLLIAAGRDVSAPDPMVSRDLGTLAPTAGVGPDGVPTQNGPGNDTVLPSTEQQPDRPVLDLSGTWRSQRVDTDHGLSLRDRPSAMAELERTAGGRQLPGYDDSGWAQHRVPMPEGERRGAAQGSTEPGSGPETYENGVWYRRTVTAPVPAPGQRVRLEFDAVASIADVWVDGRWAGVHEGGYTPFVLDVTDAVAARGGRPVTVAVRVDNPPLGSRADTLPARRVDWPNDTGILGGVRMEYVPAGGIARLDAVPTRLGDTDPAERIGLDTTVVTGPDVDPDAVALRLTRARTDPALLASPRPSDLDGAPAGFRETGRTVTREPDRTVVRISLEVDRPALWSPSDPALHVLTASVPGDRYATQVGLRTVGVADGSPQVLLNGRPARFAGLNRHQEWPDSGRAVTDPGRIVSDLRDVKGTGANLLRTAHYPNDPLTYLVADRLGLAVIEEIPSWWADAEQFADQEQRGVAEQTWREMIFRDRNRASVLAWSATNESFAPQRRAAFLNRLVRDLRTGYPDGRLVTQSAAVDRPGPDDPSRDQLDVAGYTLYPGVFDGGSAPEAAVRARDTLARIRAARPDQPVWATEFGAYARQDDALAGRQAAQFDALWPVLRDDPGVAGAAWWAQRDGYTPLAGVNTFGLRTLSGGDGRGGKPRPVDGALRRAYAAAPPVPAPGPVLPQRAPLVPEPVEQPEPGPDMPGLLSSFDTADPAEPAGGAQVGPAVDGRLPVFPTGRTPSVRVGLRHPPAELRDRICVTVDDPVGGAAVRFTVPRPDDPTPENPTGAARIDADGRTTPGEPTRLCAGLDRGGSGGGGSEGKGGSTPDRARTITVTLDRGDDRRPHPEPVQLSDLRSG